MIRPAPSGVDVWIATLDEGDALSPEALGSTDDAARYKRIVPPARKRHFLFRRAVRKYVLDQYALKYGVKETRDQKPVLVTPGELTKVHFNTSASRQLCAIGVSDAPLGIDIEALPPRVNLAKICARFVPSPEEEDWALASEALERHLATSLWCRLEAYVKLHGTRLHTMLFGEGLMQTWLAGTDHRAALILGARYVCCISQRTEVLVKQVFHIDNAQLARGEAPIRVFSAGLTTTSRPIEHATRSALADFVTTTID
jgi:hypothetical protein